MDPQANAMTPATTLDKTQRRRIRIASFCLFLKSLHPACRVKFLLQTASACYFWLLPVGPSPALWLLALVFVTGPLGLRLWTYSLSLYKDTARTDSTVLVAGLALWAAIVTAVHWRTELFLGVYDATWRLWDLPLFLIAFPILALDILTVKISWIFLLGPCGFWRLVRAIIEWFHVQLFFAWRLTAGLCRVFSEVLEDKILLGHWRKRRSTTEFELALHSEPFDYSPLSPNLTTIRLLILNPGYRKDPVSCNLFEVELKSAPKYEAVSYRCKPDADTSANPCFIIVNNRKLRVGSHELSLLEDMRSAILPRVLWIDTVCIDQQSETDRLRHVRFKGNIYSSAALVTVWLGSPSREAVGTGMKGISKWFPRWASESKLFANMLETLFIVLAFQLVDQLRINTMFTRDHMKACKHASRHRFTPWWIPLVHLLDHEWFEDIWVAQEACLARDIRVMYGSLSCDWGYFYGGLETIYKNDLLTLELSWTQEGELNRTQSRTWHISSAVLLQQWRLRLLFLEKPPHFRDMISKVHLPVFKEADPRDKVFAVQGLAAKGTCQGNRDTEPDYTKDTRQVYIGAANRVIEENGVFELLSHAGIGYVDNPDDMQDVPSWVPDWNLNQGACPLGYTETHKVPYCAGGTCTVPRTAPSIVGDSLFLEGAVQLDVVASLAPTWYNPDRWEVSEVISRFRGSRELVMTSSAAKELYQRMTGRDDAENLMVEVTMRLCIGDRSEKEWPISVSVSESYERWLMAERLQDHLDEISQQQDGDTTLDDDSLEGSIAGRRYVELLRSAWAGRRVAVTQQGYVCLIPRHARIGDVIWLVDGAQTPYVLRSCGPKVRDSWNFVGDCYVHGVMDGSAIADGRPREVIKLV